MEKRTARIPILENESLISALLQKALLEPGYEIAGVFSTGEAATKAVAEQERKHLQPDSGEAGFKNVVEDAPGLPLSAASLTRLVR